jgi:hypothetical protein
MTNEERIERLEKEVRELRSAYADLYALEAKTLATIKAHIEGEPPAKAAARRCAEIADDYSALAVAQKIREEFGL